MPVTNRKLISVTWLERIAASKGWALNPDSETVLKVLQGMNDRLKRHGRPYCPCRILSGDPDMDRTYICPCDSAKKDVPSKGACHCNLYVRP